MPTWMQIYKARNIPGTIGISEVLNALIGHGLQLKFFNEYSYSPYPCFKNIIQGTDGNWRVKGLEDKIPMVYSLKAAK
jgi:hypothetical protein